jgi:hypothetical protein
LEVFAKTPEFFVRSCNASTTKFRSRFARCAGFGPAEPGYICRFAHQTPNMLSY